MGELSLFSCFSETPSSSEITKENFENFAKEASEGESIDSDLDQILFRQTGMGALAQHIKSLFLKMLHLDPNQRLSPLEALEELNSLLSDLDVNSEVSGGSFSDSSLGRRVSFTSVLFKRPLISKLFLYLKS